MQLHTFLPLLLKRQLGEHLAEAHEVGREVAAGHHERDGGHDKDDAAQEARRERLPEHEHADDHGRERLQRAEDGGRRGTDILDGQGGATQRYDGGEYGQRDKGAPQVPLVGGYEVQAPPEVQPHEEDKHSERQPVEHELERGDVFERGPVNAHDLNGIRQRRGHDEGHADEAERVAVLSPIEQSYTAQRQYDAECGRPREPFLEADGHDERHHDGIDEQQRGGDAGRHVVVTLEQRERRDGEQEAHERDGQDFLALQLEVAAAQLDHQRQDGQREQVTEEQHRVRVEPRPVERQREQRIQPVGGRRNGPEDVTFGFGGHINLPIRSFKKDMLIGFRHRRHFIIEVIQQLIYLV